MDGEPLTELVPEERMSYEAAFNSSLHDYRVSIELTPSEGGTDVRWHGTYRTRPELEEVIPGFLPTYMQGMVDGLAAYAAEHAPPVVAETGTEN